MFQFNQGAYAGPAVFTENSLQVCTNREKNRWVVSLKQVNAQTELKSNPTITGANSKVIMWVSC